MRRIAFGLAGAAAALVAACAVLVVRAPLTGVDEALLAALRQGSGLSIETNGRTTVSLFPTPQVRIDGVSLARPGEPPFAVARELVGSPRLMALLAGRVELGAVTLRSAQIALDRLPIDDMFAALRAMPPHRIAPPEIRVTDGKLAWDGRSIEGVEAGLAWPGSGRALSISGYGSFAGRPVEAAFTLSDPAALARGEEAPFRARLEGGGARVVFDGAASGRDGPRFSGALSARAGSLRETLKWLGAPAPRRSSPLSGFSLAGHAEADRDGLSVTNAELDLEGDSFLGAGRFTTVQGRPTIEATLDSERLELDPYVKGIAPALRQDGGWNVKPIDLASLSNFSLDLRISADEVRLGAFRFGETAATVTIADGALDLSVGETSAYGGALGGRLSVEPSAGAARVRLQAAMTDVGLDKALKGFVDKPTVAGAVTGDFAVEGRGRSIADVIAALDGRGEARIADGAIAGFGYSRTLALAGLRGRMSVRDAEARIVVSKGVARTDDLSIVGPEAALFLAGEANLVERSLKLEGSVKPANGSWALPVKVEGAFGSPKLRPNLSAKDLAAEAARSRSSIAASQR